MAAVNSTSSSPVETPASEKHTKALQFIEDMTRNAESIQKNVLAEILTANAQTTEYLRGFNLGGATDPETFRSTVPVVNYEDLQPLIQRIADGDRSPILSAHPFSELIISSGTSGGECKLFPTTDEDAARSGLIVGLLTPVMNLHVKGLDKGKALYFLFARYETRTSGGLPARTVLTRYYRSARFKTRPYDPYNVYTSPDEAILCVDPFQSMYTQMLCGLYDRDQVLRIGAVFASALIRAIKFLQLNCQQLTHDIRTGSFNPKVTNPSIRECMTRISRADKDLADFIAGECGKDNWEGIISRIWPNAKYLDAIVTGSMARSIPILDYFSRGLPIACTTYASSECFFGINLDPMCKPSEVSYTLMPSLAFFEFSPHGPGSTRPVDDSELVGLVDVEVGREYELVITTYSGLYRYRVGDILRVTGFCNSAPQFRFIGRKNTVLSIESDKTDERELHSAVENASRLLGKFNVCVIEYTSYADTTTIPGHYVIYWELISTGSGSGSGKWPNEEVLAQCCLAMEESLNWTYRRFRVEDNSIGPLEIRVVKNGTFERLMDHAISRGASINQYKVPRCVNSETMLGLLDSAIVSTHFSPSLPHWATDDPSKING